jgi:hypothetical protein
MTEDGGGRKGGGVAALSGIWGEGGVWGLPRAQWRGAGGECAVFGNEIWGNMGFCEIGWVGLNGLRVWGAVV